MWLLLAWASACKSWTRRVFPHIRKQQFAGCQCVTSPSRCNAQVALTWLCHTDWMIYLQVSPNLWANYSLVRTFVSVLFIFLYPKWICIGLASWQLRKYTIQKTHKHAQDLADFYLSANICCYLLLSQCPQWARSSAIMRLCSSIVTIRGHKQVSWSFPHCYNVTGEALGISCWTLPESQGRHQFQILWCIV